MRKVFISRNLKPSSPIRDVIANNQLVAKSLIQFSALDFDTPQADWIFFYSRNGVKYFFENGNYALYPYLWACLSEGTADELSHYVTDVSFVGNGSPEEVAQAYEHVINPEQVTCFVRAENSLDSIKKRIDQAQNFSIPAYRNTQIDEIPNEEFDILIFTSPMNVDAWFAKREYQDEKVISIGETTADHLKTKYGITDIIVAAISSESSIAESLGSLL